ncbi:hypothetical protein HMPREF0758_0400 [Serratia odorifera DSM 4582]|uniref:Uncharacterized protein n=1 Tax=Serratia odorifera DSM 4582 TaxID=667129 RepID=D4DWV0_SEROD|nr:hypothetical protein HMPREF0758_0400 [Serratia odorifera DSM 4582]
MAVSEAKSQIELTLQKVTKKVIFLTPLALKRGMLNPSKTERQER